MFRSSANAVKLVAAAPRACQRCQCPQLWRSTRTYLPLVTLASRPLSTKVAQNVADRAVSSEETQPSLSAVPAKTPRNVGQQPKSHKPPKRRLEAASQPLRNAPSASRGPILQCIAHTTAERYDLPALAMLLRQLGVKYDEVPEGDRERAIVVGHWKGRGGAERLVRGKDIKRAGASIVDEGDEEDDLSGGFHYGERGEIWVFGSGSYVTWGISEEEGRAFLREVIRHKASRIEVERLMDREVEVEEVDFVVDPRA